MLHLAHDLLQHDAQLFPRLQRLDRRMMPPAFLLVCFRIRAPLRFRVPRAVSACTARRRECGTAQTASAGWVAREKQNSAPTAPL